MAGQFAGRAVTGGPGRGPRGRLTTLSSGVRHCPISGCGDQIDPSRLMCRRHWYMVPKETRDEVWATWRSGHGAYSRGHRNAVRRAVAAVLEAAGHADGHRTGHADGHADGRTTGHADGHASGHADGHASGMATVGDSAG